MWDSERHILLIESDGARLYREEDLRAPLAAFAADAAGYAEWKAWRGQHPRLPLLCLANLPDEGFVNTRIPRLPARERKDVLARKIRQHFPDTPYVCARSLQGGKQEKGERREERLLLAALPAIFLDSWLDGAEAGSLLGLYALAQLCEPLAATLALPKNAILLTLHGGSLRQTLLLDGVPCFSRLTDLAEEHGERGAYIREETQRLCAYLARQHLVAPETLLPLCPLFPLAESERESLQAAFPLADIPTNIAVDETLFLGLLARHRPKTQYAPPRLCGGHSSWRRGLAWLGLACLLAGLAHGGWQLHQAEAFRQRAESAEASIRVAEAELAALRQSAQSSDPSSDPSTYEAAEIDPEAAEAVLAALESLPDHGRENLAILMETLHRISALVERQAGLRLERLEWKGATRQWRLGVKLGDKLETGNADAGAFLQRLRRAAEARGLRVEQMTEENSIFHLLLSCEARP
ncbi:MAG: hypothetical protein LBB55_02345 [Zoogloeaceae bacterium]|jgi:hypothetical protein|nr:hypothetical protein [Zoogloeaceae bacterium]